MSLTQKLKNSSTDIPEYFKDVQITGLLKADEELRLAIKLKGFKSKDPEESAVALEARDHLVRANLRLVASIARKYVGNGVDFLDLIEEGNLALVNKTPEFNPQLEVRFSTFITPWIRRSILNVIESTNTSIRLPSYMKKLIFEWQTASSCFQEKAEDSVILDKMFELRVAHRSEKLKRLLHTDSANTDRSLTESLSSQVISIRNTKKAKQIENLQKQLSPKNIEKLRVTKRQYNLLKSALHQIENTLPTGSALTQEIDPLKKVASVDKEPSASIERVEALEILNRSFNSLDTQEQLIVSQRFPCDDREPLTLKAIGISIGRTKESVRLTERSALGKLREELQAMGYEDPPA